MVERVERFNAKLHGLPLGDRKILNQREVQVPDARTSQSVAAQVAISSRFGVGEGTQVEPLIGALLVGRQIGVSAGRVQAVPVSADDLAGCVPACIQVKRAAAGGIKDRTD